MRTPVYLKSVALAVAGLLARNGAGGVLTNGVETLSGWERDRVVLATTGAGVAGVTVWGVFNWDYFSKAPNAESEGWFGADTEDGGVDKLGHLYVTYLLSHGVATLYEHWRFSQADAALYGALTSFAVMGYMEFGDSFSSYGFSYEDMLMNTAGALLGYLLYVRPDWSEKIDLRCEVGLSPSQADVVTDYDNTRFLVALKLNGFEWFRESWLRHVELHAGYYAEGYWDDAEPDERHPYVGIGFNLTDLFGRQGWGVASTVFKYVQIPYTSAIYEFDL